MISLYRYDYGAVSSNYFVVAVSYSDAEKTILENGHKSPATIDLLSSNIFISDEAATEANDA